MKAGDRITIRNPLDFFTGHVDSLNADGSAHIAGQIKHVSHSEQIFGPDSIDDGSGVDPRGDCEGNAGRDIGFNNTGDYVYTWPLSSED